MAGEHVGLQSEMVRLFQAPVVDDWQLQVPEFLGRYERLLTAHEFLTAGNNVATFTYTTIGFTLASFSLTVYTFTHAYTGMPVL